MAFALLLQVVFVVPLAIRMAGEAMQLSLADAPICTMSDHAPATSDHHPDHPMGGTTHSQCLICQAHALPLGLLVVALFSLAAILAPTVARSAVVSASPWRRERYRSYCSRAPPAAA